MINNLALIAGANYISSVHSLEQKPLNDGTLVQTDATSKNEQTYEISDPEFYAQHVDEFA